MRAHELESQSPLPEAAMRPREYSAALGADVGIKVGYEFEVCMPLEYISGTKKNTPPTRKTIAAAISNSNALSELINTREDLERFDRVFRARRGATLFPTAVAAYDDLVERSQRRVVETWNKIPEEYRLIIKRHIDRVGAENAAKKVFPHSALRLLNDQLMYAAAVLGAVDAMKSSAPKVFRYVYEQHYSDIWLALKGAVVTVSENYGVLKHQTGEGGAYELDTRFNGYYDYDLDAARDYLGDHYEHGLVAALDLDEDELYIRGARRAARQLESAFNMPATVFKEYHQSAKRPGRWYIEPDGSIQPHVDDAGAEIVTPPYPLGQAVGVLKNFYALARGNGWYTSADNHTGLHINISIPGEVDLLKLALFSGDEWVLRKWGREFSEYAESIVRHLRSEGGGSITAGIDTARRAEILGDIAARHGSKHYSSISSENGRYVSFRHVGGNYLKEYDEVYTVLGRFVRALQIAADPTAYREEYLKKLYTLTSSGGVTTQRVSMLRQLIATIRRDGCPALRISAVAYSAAAARRLDTRAVQTVLQSSGLDYSVGPVAKYLGRAPRGAVRDALLSHAGNDIAGMLSKVIERAGDSQLLSGVWVPWMTGGRDPVSALYKFAAVKNLPPTRLMTDSAGSWLGFVAAERITLPPDSPQSREILARLYDAARKYLSSTKKEQMNENMNEADRRFMWYQQERDREPRQKQQQLYYFAYGMLTDPDHMSMYSDAELVGRAQLRDYKLELLQHANIIKSTENMWGTLWRIDTDILDSLDATEGYPRYYTRIVRDVTTDDGNTYSAQIYVMTDRSRAASLYSEPDLGYLKMIGRGYQHAGIPLEQLFHAYKRMQHRLQVLSSDRDDDSDDKV